MYVVSDDACLYAESYVVAYARRKAGDSQWGQLVRLWAWLPCPWAWLPCPWAAPGQPLLPCSTERAAAHRLAGPLPGCEGGGGPCLLPPRRVPAAGGARQAHASPPLPAVPAVPAQVVFLVQYYIGEVDGVNATTPLAPGLDYAQALPPDAQQPLASIDSLVQVGLGGPLVHRVGWLLHTACPA